jgi:phosphatidylethanolamine/phosphatidyl-N-methylethanolamine N-methyltransferase
MGRRSELRRSLAARFDDEVRFFRGWMTRPKAVGSVIPTSSFTARRMASVVEPASGLAVLETGPGTGVITKAILERGVAPENLYALEFSPEFALHLRRNFPKVNVIEGDAFDLDGSLPDTAPKAFDCVISGIPLLNFPVERRVAYLESLLSRIAPGRPVVQLTYGPKSPVPPGLGNYTVEHFDFVIRNLPPTQLWVYRRGRGN